MLKGSGEGTQFGGNRCLGFVGGYMRTIQMTGSTPLKHQELSPHL